MAEVIKYGVIGDPELFRELEAAGERLASMATPAGRLLQSVLERSAAAKAKVVAADEQEGGLRAILNYGHTLGPCGGSPLRLRHLPARRGRGHRHGGRRRTGAGAGPLEP